MNVLEIFIAHELYGDPNKTYVTSDGKKLYFLLGGALVYIEAPVGSSYSGMSEKELNQARQEAILAR